MTPLVATIPRYLDESTRPARWHGWRMAPTHGFRSLEEIRRRIISELVDHEIVSERRLRRRERLARRVRSVFTHLR
jgi:hypothetical protein